MARTFNTRRASGRRSKFEEKIAEQLDTADIPYGYETLKIKYTVPEREATYTPDFALPNGIIIETKGWPFESKDRAKHLLIKEQRPDLDIRFVFASPNSALYPGSLTSYADWARQHGFKFADKIIPDEWLEGCVDTSRYQEVVGKLTPTKTKKSSSPTSRSTRRKTRTNTQAS